MTVFFSEDPATKTVELCVKGKVTVEDFDAIKEPLQAFIDRHGTIKIIEIVESFDGFEAGVLLPGMRFDLKNLSHISQAAVVSDIGWISPLTKAVGRLMPTRVRMFHMDELDEARAWITAPEGAA